MKVLESKREPDGRLSVLVEDMTVLDLIEMLKNFPQNLQIRADSRDDGYSKRIEIGMWVAECSREGQTVRIGGIL